MANARMHIVVTTETRGRLAARYLPTVALGLLAACAGGDGAAVDEGAFPRPAIEWNPERYVAYRTFTAPAIDGRLDDAAWQSAAWTRDFVDIEGPHLPAPTYRTRVKMLWDADDLYVGAELEDPHVWGSLTDRDAVIYQDNDFEVFIDPDGDTHNYYELEINSLGTEWDLFLARPYRDGGPALNAWNIGGLETAVSVRGTLNVATDRDEGWSVEIALPWSVLREAADGPAPPQDGDQWRLNFSRVQWRHEIRGGRYVKITTPSEGRSRPEENWVWSPQGLIDMHYPEMWGIVQFSTRTGVRDDTTAFFPRETDRAKWRLREVYYAERNWHRRHARYTDDLRALGLSHLGGTVTLAATPDLFDARLTVGGRVLHIGQDGRVEFR